MEKLIAPETLTKGGNLPEQWKRYLRTFKKLLMATGRADKPGPIVITLLLRTIGGRGSGVLCLVCSRGRPDPGKRKYDAVIAKLNSI